MVRNRPLSPHLQIYRLPLNALLSIAHRITGLVLSLGTLVVIYVLYMAATGPGSFEPVHRALTSWPGQGALWLFVYALYFHMCTGVRHLVWDSGVGFAPSQVRRTGWAVLGVSLLLTASTIILTPAVYGS